MMWSFAGISNHTSEVLYLLPSYLSHVTPCPTDHSNESVNPSIFEKLPTAFATGRHWLPLVATVRQRATGTVCTPSADGTDAYQLPFSFIIFYDYNYTLPTNIIEFLIIGEATQLLVKKSIIFVPIIFAEICTHRQTTGAEKNQN